jgi:hypothetical protein
VWNGLGPPFRPIHRQNPRPTRHQSTSSGDNSSHRQPRLRDRGSALDRSSSAQPRSDAVSDPFSAESSRRCKSPYVTVHLVISRVVAIAISRESTSPRAPQFRDLSQPADARLQPAPLLHSRKPASRFSILRRSRRARTIARDGSPANPGR